MRRRELLAGLVGVAVGGLAACVRPPVAEEKLTIAGFKPIPFKNFGGLNTLQDPTDVVFGMSPDCQDVEFMPGLVRTRPGLQELGIGVQGGRTTGLFNYFQRDLKPILLFSVGGIINWVDVESPTSIVLSPGIGDQLSAMNLFGRAFLATGDGKHGLFIPRHVKSSNALGAEWSRVGQDGPYVSTLAAVENVTAGGIIAGVHKLVVIYETKDGYRTRPSSPIAALFTATGARTVDVSGIPVGPSNVFRRILAFTAAGGSEFYFIAKPVANGGTMLEDNTTTALTALNFTDIGLLAGENVDALFRRIVLPDPAGVVAYGSRAVYWGTRASVDYAKAQNPTYSLRNLSFDAGFYGNVPLGWVESVAGETKDTPGIIGFGFGLKITGNGASSPIGKIHQDGFTTSDYFRPGRAYRVRAFVTMALNSGSTGRLRIFFTGSTAPGLSLELNTASVFPKVPGLMTQPFEAQIWSASDAVQNLPTLNLQVETGVGGIFANAAECYVDELDIFPEDEPFAESVAYVSQPDDPEGIDGVKGLVIPTENDGQAVRCCFVQRGFLYLVKERGLHVTQDDGNDPADWMVQRVSEKVGTTSSRGVDLGDDWATIANEKGLWLFTGGEMSDKNNLADEIRSTWKAINWQYGSLVQVKVDLRRKRIHVMVPFTGSTVINRCFTLDYTEGFGNPIENGGVGRKWSIWNIPAASVEILQRANGVEDVIFGSSAPAPASGSASRLNDTQRSDNGVAINSYYQTAYPASESGTRLEFGYLTANVTGAGTLALRLYRGNQGDLKDLRGFTLDANGFKSLERKISEERERLAIRFGTNAVGEHFELNHLVLWVKGAPWAPVRGRN